MTVVSLSLKVSYCSCPSCDVVRYNAYMMRWSEVNDITLGYYPPSDDMSGGRSSASGLWKAKLWIRGN